MRLLGRLRRRRLLQHRGPLYRDRGTAFSRLLTTLALIAFSSNSYTSRSNRSHSSTIDSCKRVGINFTTRIHELSLGLSSNLVHRVPGGRWIAARRLHFPVSIVWRHHVIIRYYYSVLISRLIMLLSRQALVWSALNIALLLIIY